MPGSNTERLVESNIFKLIARGCMVALLPVALFVASQMIGWLKDYTAEQKKQLEAVNTSVQKVSETINGRVDGVNAQLNTTNQNVNAATQSIQTINTTIAEGLRQTLESQGKRIEALERQQDTLRDRLDTERDRVTGLVGKVEAMDTLSKIQSPQRGKQ
jgi:chromosome segregation ATPase